MSTAIDVRQAQPSDAARLHALRAALSGETDFLLLEPQESRDGADDEGPRIAWMNERPNCLSLVADVSGQLVGFLNAMGGQVNRQRHCCRLALGVRRSHWGQGVATAMLAEALSWSRRVGIVRVELTVHTTNHRALALYKRAGFQVEGTRRCSLMVAGARTDEFLMSVINEA